MAEIIKARVWQKIDTEVNWNANPLILGPGEAAFVVTPSGAPVNFKLGDGTKTFSQLPWYFDWGAQAGVPKAATPSTVFPPGEPGFYLPEVDGTYNGITVDLSEGVNYLIWDGASLSKIVYPIDLSGYAKKQDVSPLVWGVGDDKGNVFIWTDQNLETHLKLSEDSWPPVPPFRQTAESLIQSSDASKDGIWNQWIEPIAVTDSGGNVWFASVGSKGNLYVTKRSPNGVILRKKVGDILTNLGGFESDDHNAPAILLDERPGAPYPIMVFQCDHNTTPMRVWKFTSLDPNEWNTATYETIGTANLAYCEPHRYGDEIFIFARRSPTPRPWRVIYSPDNGATWQARDIFSSPATWLYMLTKTKDNGTGINIGCVGHPINSTENSLFFLELDFASGEVRSPGNGVVISDIRAAIADVGFVTIDPFDVGMVVYQATGTESTRMWDVSRGNTTVSVVLSVFPNINQSMQTFRDSIYRCVTFSAATGVISRDVDLGECGMPLENPKGNTFYVAGACMLDNNNVFGCVWKNQSMIDGGNDITGDTGKSWAYHYDLNADEKTEILASDLKLMRPIAVTGYQKIVLCEASKYVTYDDFTSNVLLIDKYDFNI